MAYSRKQCAHIGSHDGERGEGVGTCKIWNGKTGCRENWAPVLQSHCNSTVHSNAPAPTRTGTREQTCGSLCLLFLPLGLLPLLHLFAALLLLCLQQPLPLLLQILGALGQFCGQKKAALRPRCNGLPRGSALSGPGNDGSLLTVITVWTVLSRREANVFVMNTVDTTYHVAPHPTILISRTVYHSGLIGPDAQGPSVQHTPHGPPAARILRAVGV